MGLLTTRKTICVLMKEAYKRNWITSLDGNISHFDGSTMIITPSGRVKHDLTELDIKGVDINNPTDDVSIEFEMHKLIQLQKGGGVVIHFHPTYAVSAMLAGIKLSEIHEYFPELNRYTKVGQCVDKIYPGEESLAIQTAHNIQDADIVGLKGHGVTSWGRTFEEAFQHIERLEHCCKMALIAGGFNEI